MWIDVLALVLLAAFVLSGALRGAWASGLALLVLVGAYAAALILAPAFGREVAGALELPVVIGTGVAGAGAFVAAFLALGLLAALLRWLERRRRDGAPRSAGDRALGACFGALRGGLLAVLLGVAGYWLQALAALSPDAGVPRLGESAVASASQSLVAVAAGAWVDADSPGGRMTVHAVANPAETFGALQAILDDPRVQLLRDDPDFWRAVGEGDVDGATQRISFATIAHSDELRGRFAASGLVAEPAAADPGAFRDAVSVALTQAGPRIRDLRRDPELEQLARDPQVVRLLESGDTLGLLRHPGFRRLVDRVTTG